MRALVPALSGPALSGPALPLRLVGLVSCLIAALVTAGCQMPFQGRSVPEPVQAAPPSPPPAAAQPARVEPAQPAPVPAAQTPVPASDGMVRIGLLLPLSGRLSTVGTALLEAAQLAVFELADERFMLIVRDTGDTPEAAIAAADSVLAAGAQLIVGPLQGALTREVAPIARRAGVSIISFSNDAKVAGPGIYVLGAAPEEQVARIIGYAAERGLKRVAAIVPDDAYGALVARSFQDAAAKARLDVVAIQVTNANGEELSQVVRRLTRHDERRARALALAASAEQNSEPSSPPPETTPAPFEAILVAAPVERARELATYLSHYDAASPGVRLLGTSLWAGANLGADRALQGAWFPAALPEVRQRFDARFRQAFRHAPSRLASLAYDATALAALLARRGSGAPDYSGATLNSPYGFIGNEGLFRFRQDGVAERALAVFEITSAGPAIVSEPPGQFEASN